MIGKEEIIRFSKSMKIRPNILEKDYVLGWILRAVSHQPILAQTWTFKGGTCLKKCYFEQYRFSEDLDFTLNPEFELTQSHASSKRALFASLRREWN